MPTSGALQIFYGTVPLMAALLLANWNSNKRLDDLGTCSNKSIDDLALSLNKSLDDVKASIDKLESRVSAFEKS